MATYTIISDDGAWVGIFDGEVIGQRAKRVTERVWMIPVDGSSDEPEYRLAKRITIRRARPDGVAYGAPLRADEIRWELAEEIASALGGGEAEIGGQRYQW